MLFFRLLVISSTIFLFSNQVFAQKLEDYRAKIDSLVLLTNPRSFNGVVLIQQNGKVKYKRAFGYSSADKKELLKTDAKFSTMSIAKQFTAALTLQQVEKGVIDLNTPIRKYLPDFKYSWADTVTVHQLLNNTSGLYSEDITKPLKFAPGSAFSYSNIGYYVVGLVLEKQSGRSFQELVTALFKTCKMNNSYYPDSANSRSLSKGHTVTKEGHVRLNDRLSFTPINYFGSHLIVSAGDLAKWNEHLHGGKVLKPYTYELMTNYSITNIHQVFSEKPIGYGYGLRINDKEDVYEIGHTGFHPSEGYTALNLYFPKTKTSVIVMENFANENFDIAYFFEIEIRKIVKMSGLLD